MDDFVHKNGQKYIIEIEEAIDINNIYLSTFNTIFENEYKENLDHTTVIIPITAKTPEFSFFIKTNKSIGFKDDRNLRFVPFINKKLKTLKIEDFFYSDLIENTISLKERILKRIVNFICKNFTGFELYLLLKSNLDYRNIDDLANKFTNINHDFANNIEMPTIEKFYSCLGINYSENIDLVLKNKIEDDTHFKIKKRPPENLKDLKRTIIKNHNNRDKLILKKIFIIDESEKTEIYKNIEKLFKLADYMKIDVNTLIKIHFKYRNLNIEFDGWFCNICYIFGCNKHFFVDNIFVLDNYDIEKEFENYESKKENFKVD
ncbi:hypothetical protein GVAV_002764 [Gurleya vavrai]